MTTGQRLRPSSGATIAIALAIVVAAGSGPSAHRLDEYLQAARVDIQPESVRVELDLTPGMDVAESIIATIDRNRDDALSIDEKDEYVRQVASALQVRLDGEPLHLRLTSSTFPALSALRAGEGTIRLRARASHPHLSTGGHELFFQNRHLAGHSVYLANVLVPESAAMTVTRQRRDDEQRELTIDYRLGGASMGSSFAWLLVALPFAAVLLVRVARRQAA